MLPAGTVKIPRLSQEVAPTAAWRTEWRTVVREAWAVFKRHPVALVVPGAVLFAIFGVPAALVDGIDTDAGLPTVLVAIAAQLLGLVASFLYYGYCEEVVRRARAAGPLSVGDALAETGRVVPKLILAGFVTWFCILIGFLLLILPGLWLLTRWALVSQVISFEHLGVLRAIRRSQELTRRRVRLIFATVVLAIALSEIGSEVVGAAGAWLASNDKVGEIVGGAAGQLLTGAFAGTVIATVYFRVRGGSGTPH